MEQIFTEEQQNLLKISKESMEKCGMNERDYVIMITFIGEVMGDKVEYTVPATIDWCRQYCEDPASVGVYAPIKSSRLVYLLR